MYLLCTLALVIAVYCLLKDIDLSKRSCVKVLTTPTKEGTEPKDTAAGRMYSSRNVNKVVSPLNIDC